MHQFAQQLLRLQIAQQGYNNLLFSPLGFEMLLGLALPGTQGASREALLKALEITEEEVNSYLATLQNATESLLGIKSANIHQDNHTQVKLANSLWYAAHVQVNPHYARTLDTRFPMQWRALDESPQASADKINQWASEQTEGMIPQLPIPLDENTVAVLLSALYLKGFWSREFSDATNEKEFFHKLDGNEEFCQYMSITQDTDEGQAEAYYLKKEHFHALRLMLNDGRIGLEVYLPYEKAGLPDLIAQTQGHELAAWRDEFEPAPYFYFLLPRFETKSSLKLADFAEQLGIEALFVASDDFEPMLESNEPIEISNIGQEVKIKVNKEGLEAAAVTYMVAVGGAAFGEEPERHEMIVFEADHPFLYRIVDTVTQQTLFQGIFTTPVTTQDVFLAHFNQRTYKTYKKNLVELSGQECFVLGLLLLELVIKQTPFKYNQMEVFIEQIWAELATKKEFDNEVLRQDLHTYVEVLMNTFEGEDGWRPTEGKFVDVAEEISPVIEDLIGGFLNLFTLEGAIDQNDQGYCVDFVNEALKTHIQLPNYDHTIALIRSRQNDHSVQRIGVDELLFDEVPNKIEYTEEEKRAKAKEQAEIALARKIAPIERPLKVGFITYALTKLRAGLDEKSEVMDKIMAQLQLYVNKPNQAPRHKAMEAIHWAIYSKLYDTQEGFDTKDRLKLKLLRKKQPDVVALLTILLAELVERHFWRVYDAKQTNELFEKVNVLFVKNGLSALPANNLMTMAIEMPKGTVYNAAFFEGIA